VVVFTPGAVAALAAAVASCPAPATPPPPPTDRPTYAMTLSIGGGKKVVRGTSHVSFALDRASDRIVFRLWPNMPVQRAVGARLDVSNVRVGAAAVTTSTPDPTTLVLARPVAAGERVLVTMNWTLQLPQRPTERLASRFGVRLSSFFPLLAWNGTDWALDPPAPQLETWTSPVADFAVRITAPKGMRVLASGANVGRGRWRAVAVRDFALEAGPLRVARRTVRVPGPVVVTVASTSRLVPLRTVLGTAVHALTSFSRRYAPYPWSTYTVIVTTDRLSLGEEYPTIVFVSEDLPSSVVVHETAHQWFYSLVGDNQARDPWLDESLAEWATARLTGSLTIEEATFIPDKVRDRLGEPMTFWGPLPFMPLVWDGLYLQGVQALASLGNDDGVDCALQTYIQNEAYKTALPSDLLAALIPTFANAEAVLTGYGVRF
jgi:Peptidase family M1 domain